MDKTRHTLRQINTNSNKQIINLQGLNCSNCARKIGQEVRLIDGVEAANVDFVSQKLTIQINDKSKSKFIVKQAAQTAIDIEPSINISFEEKSFEESNQKPATFNRKLLNRILLSIGASIFLITIWLNLPPWAEFSLFFLSYILVGGEILLKAIKNISKGHIFDENFLMCIATIGAFAIGNYPEGVAVMLFYQIGELFQDLAVNHSRKSISSLMDIRPDYANLKIDDDVRKVSPEQIGIGDYILVKSGEKIPLDGKVVNGKASLDTSALTGESLPVDVQPGSEVLSGSINKSGLLTIQVTKEFGDSTVSKILDLVQNASSQKAPAENFITKFARYYTPFVVFAALALAIIPPLVIPNTTFSEWINRALIFLVVSCPCALVISIPLSFFGGIGSASKNGVLIKGSNYLESLNNVETIVFDKTGTLTKGVFNVTQIIPANGLTKEQLLSYAAHAEYFSNHPIALSIKKLYGKEIDIESISDYEELAGRGISVKIDGKSVLSGNSKLMDTKKITYQQNNTPGTILHLAINNVYAGSLVISDEIKSDSKQTINKLKNMGIKKIVMLTGDNKAVGEAVAQEIGLDAVYTDLLPHQKVEKLESLEKNKTKKGKLAFVGDGINDAPVLARSDVGIAMGSLGSDAAIEAADIVLMTDEPSKLIKAIQIAKKTRRIVLQNIFFALGVKAVILILGAFGIATMWEAVFGDVGVSLIAIINAMRVLGVAKKPITPNAEIKG